MGRLWLTTLALIEPILFIYEVCIVYSVTSIMSTSIYLACVCRHNRSHQDMRRAGVDPVSTLSDTKQIQIDYPPPPPPPPV